MGIEINKQKVTSATLQSRIDDFERKKRNTLASTSNLGDKIGEYEALKDDEEWSVREQAANALGKLRAHKSVEPLVHALRHDKDGGVRTAAIWALERIGHPDAVPGLVDALMDATLREDAARVLKKLGDSRATTALVEGLHASNWIVRRHAAEALGKIGDPQSLDPLIEALADEDWLVRRNAAESLARLKDNRAIDPLVPLLEDENEMVRDTAEGALSSLGWTPSSSK